MRKVDEAFARRLKITSFGKDGLIYYSLYTGGYWDIVGFRFLLDERITLRLMHFEDEFLDDESFVAEQYGNSYFSFDVPGCQRFLQFIEHTILQKEVMPRSRRPYFEMLDTSQLRKLHYSGTEEGRWYRYAAKAVFGENEKISLMSLPRWNKKYGVHQIDSLWLITLDTTQLENDQFELIRDSHGLGTITVTREALEELVSMVRETLREIE